MNQKILVGLTEMQDGLTRLFEQEGIPFKKAELAGKTKREQFATIVLNSPLRENRLKNLLAFANAGGTVLATPDCSSQLLLGIKFEYKSINPVFPSGKFFQGAGTLWLNQNIAVFQGNKPGQPLEKKIGKGTLIVLPFDPNRAVLEHDYERRAFFSEKACPAEFASKTGKATVRAIVRNCLISLFESRDIPLVQFWYYPKKHSSVFCFHVDLDFIDRDTTTSIELFNSLAFEPVWFLNIKAAENVENQRIIELVLRQKFVGQHGFEHNYWDDQTRAFCNVIEGDKKLKEFGINPKAFSAPNGVWGSGIAKAVGKNKYLFEIAFSLDNDNLPFYPIVNKQKATTLFIPVHPVGIALLKQLDFNEEDLGKYFASVIDRNEKANIPIMLYSHPFKEIGRFPKVIEKILDTVKSKNIWVTNYFEFAKWWKQRMQSSFSAELSDDRLMVKSNAPKDACFRIVMHGKEFFTDTMQGQINLLELNQGKKLFSGFLYDTVEKASPFGKKHRAKHIAGTILASVKRHKKNLSQKRLR